jgi:signal transduction histidine kinase
VGIRPKIFLIFFAFGVVPVLVLVYVNHLNGVEAVERVLRADLEHEMALVAKGVEARQREQEESLKELARLPALRAYVQSAKQTGTSTPTPKPKPTQTGAPVNIPSTEPAADTEAAAVPGDVRAEINAFLKSKYYAGVTCLSVDRRVLVQFEIDSRANAGEAVRYRTRDFLSNGNADERVWSVGEITPLRAPPALVPTGMILRYTVPVFVSEEGASARRGALVTDMKVDALFSRSAGGLAESPGAVALDSETAATGAERTILALDPKGNTIYHSNPALRYQPVSSAMPTFNAVADLMLKTEGGSAFYDATGSRWLVVYRRLAQADASLAVAGNYSTAVGSLRSRGFVSLVLALLIGILTAVILSVVVGRTARSIERVTEGAVAIAGGQLDQRIEVRSSDETRLLAESFNIMTDRLREQMAREAEMRQFQAFLRLSAMMTHDLKNAIAALSMIVSNMERHFHREEFRADAMRSLTLATDKLRAMVAKLSGPVESLSGEYKRPMPTDLVPLIQRVLDATVLQASTIRLETRLPDRLVAPVDAERIERVIENLIINALEAMGSGEGRLTVEGGEDAPGKLFFSVADTGPGMTEEFRRTRLFRAFATTKRKGVGLGLYTCREVVRAHGGQIEVESQVGSGTCFRVVLPSAADHVA